MSKLTKEVVEHVAKLSELKFSEKELELYTQKFSRVLEYVEKLNELNTKGIEPMSHAISDSGDSVMREDKVEHFAFVNEIVENFPERDENFVKVPKIVASG